MSDQDIITQTQDSELTMGSTSPLLLVLGSGPDIGSSTARQFARKGFFSKIALASRDAGRLESEAEEVRKAGGQEVEVSTFQTDLSDMKSLKSTLEDVEKLGPLGCVFYNGARIKITDILTTPVEELEEDYRVGAACAVISCSNLTRCQMTNVGLYVKAQWAIPLLQRTGHDKPSFIVTNTFLTAKPLPVLLSLSASKAAQHNMVRNLHEAFGKRTTSA